MSSNKSGWIKKGSLIAFPYGWQRPARTEEWIYETILNYHLSSPFVEYICFPWATLVDLINKGKIIEAQFYLEALNDVPIKKSLIRITAFQHVDIDPVIDIFESLKIDKIFWAHKRIGVNVLKSCCIGPLPLYPWAYSFNSHLDLKPLKERSYLVSFVGTNSCSYMSDIRDKIFNVNIPAAVIIKRSEWYFEGYVYKSQINGAALEEEYINNKLTEAQEFIDVLSNTKISLCPVGMGPNTIRYWESLAFGCIPLLLSDCFDKPVISNRWRDIKVLEEDFENYLEDLPRKWDLNLCHLHSGNPILSFEEITRDWLGESVFNVFESSFIKNIYKESCI